MITHKYRQLNRMFYRIQERYIAFRGLNYRFKNRLYSNWFAICVQRTKPGLQKMEDFVRERRRVICEDRLTYNYEYLHCTTIVIIGIIIV